MAVGIGLAAAAVHRVAASAQGGAPKLVAAHVCNHGQRQNLVRDKPYTLEETLAKQ